MDDVTMKACTFGAFVLVAYAIYSVFNPGTDGEGVFAAVITALASIGSYTLGWTSATFRKVV
jgi:hypothetical protein